MEEFIEFKRKSPLSVWGKKDEPFTSNNVLGGVWHAHIIHGKVVVIYIATATQLALYDVLEHSEFDGKGTAGNLAKFIASADLSPYLATATTKLTPVQMAEFEQLISFMVEQDRDILEAAGRGDFSGLKEFVTLVPLDWASVVETNGGNTALRKKLKHMLT